MKMKRETIVLAGIRMKVTETDTCGLNEFYDNDDDGDDVMI